MDGFHIDSVHIAPVVNEAMQSTRGGAKPQISALDAISLLRVENGR
jgi:hypothetical protein